jgi:Fur family ferric uptake transcriptional regulator
MTSAEILNNNNLKRTNLREGILEVMLSADQALSENEIRERLTDSFDRTTFYRTFKTLEEHNIIDKIVIDNQLVKYELDNSITKKKEHAHFYCDCCNSVYCLDTIHIPQTTLPEGYKAHGLELIVKGKCSKCSSND